MRRQSKSSSKSRRNDKRRAQVSAVSNVYSFSSELIVDPFQLSTCCVCGGIEDEDLIILCDGPGCNSEVHMYCLEPVMTAVPVGDWFCESCDNLGSTITLRKYFSDFEASISTLQQSPKEEYKTFLAILQQRAVPFDNWTPGFHDELVPSEFDSASEDLIGCTVRLSVSPTDYQTGRILNRRVDLNLDRWEHFVQFKSGAEGRNAPFERWLCLDEHPCLVGGSVRWARYGEFPWWPALECYQSGPEIVLRRHEDSATSPTSSHPVKRGSGSDQLWFFFFGDETYSWLSRSDPRYVAPFYQRSRDSRIYAGKRQNVAYALACVEREEQLAARRTYELLSAGILENSRATTVTLADGFTEGTVRGLADLPANFHRLLCSTQHASTAASASSQDTALSGAGVDGAVPPALSPQEEMWALHCKHSQHMLQHEYCRAVSAAGSSHHALVETGAGAVAGMANGESAALSASALTSGEVVASVAKPDFTLHRFVLLDTAYLAAECGVRLPSATTLPGAFYEAPARDGSPGQQQQQSEEGQVRKKLRPGAVRNYRNFASGIEDTEESVPEPVMAVEVPAPAVMVPPTPRFDPLPGGVSSGSAQLRVEPFSCADQLFDAYQREWYRKQEEIAAQRAAEEQARQERREQRKAKQLAEAASLQAWVEEEGEELTRRSARLSNVGSAISISRTADSYLTHVAEMAAAVDEDADPEAPPTATSSTTKTGKRPTRKSREKAREEEDYREFLASTASQPRLLTDLDREHWLGAVVTYLPTLQRGRVTDYRSGWAVVRTLEGPVNSRPYQLEIVEPGSAALAEYEDEEMWALCTGDDDTGHSKDNGYGNGVGGAESDSMPAENAASEFVFDPTAGGDAMLEGLDPMYSAFTNDAAYDAFLLTQYRVPNLNSDDAQSIFEPQSELGDPSAEVNSSQAQSSGREALSRTAPMGWQATREQQMKPSRTKLIDVAPISEEEKKRRLAALAKSRAQAQKLLLSLGSTSAGTAPAPVIRTIGIKRQPTVEFEEAPVDNWNKSTAAAAGAEGKIAPAPVLIKLGSKAPPLMKPSFLRGTGNNWRRPVPDASRSTHPSQGSFLAKKPEELVTTTRPVSEAAVGAPAVGRSATTDAFGREMWSSRPTGPVSAGDYSPRPDQRAAPAASTADPTVPSSSVEAENRTTSAVGTSAAPAWTAAVRDPRVRARLEREAAGAPSQQYIGATRDTDTRAERNSSAAVRTMRANIEYMQASYDAPSPPAARKSEDQARTQRGERRRVKFNLERDNALSLVMLDPDILNVTDPADMACFSPVSCESGSDEEEEEEKEVSFSRFNVRAIDEVDFVTRPPRRDPSSTSSVGNAAMSSSSVPRKSRFEAATPLVAAECTDDVPSLIAQKPIAAADQPSTEVIRTAPLSLTKRKATEDLEPGECEDDEPEVEESDMPSSAFIQTLSGTRQKSRFAPAAPSVQPQAAFEAMLYANEPQAPPYIAHDSEHDAAPVQALATKRKHQSLPAPDSQVSAPSGKAARTRTKIKVKIDPLYPLFNHDRDAAAAIAHMERVMPACMDNLTALLADTDMPPPQGYPLLIVPVAVMVEHEKRQQVQQQMDYAFHDPDLQPTLPAYTAATYQADSAAQPARRSRFSAPSSVPEERPVASTPAVRSSRWGHQSEHSLADAEPLYQYNDDHHEQAWGEQSHLQPEQQQQWVPVVEEYHPPYQPGVCIPLAAPAAEVWPGQPHYDVPEPQPMPQYHDDDPRMYETKDSWRYEARRRY